VDDIADLQRQLDADLLGLLDSWQNASSHDQWQQMFGGGHLASPAAAAAASPAAAADHGAAAAWQQQQQQQQEADTGAAAQPDGGGGGSSQQEHPLEQMLHPPMLPLLAGPGQVGHGAGRRNRAPLAVSIAAAGLPLIASTSHPLPTLPSPPSLCSSTRT
jgi:hypothetical protein